MDGDGLPRSAVSLVRELFEEVLGRFRESETTAIYENPRGEAERPQIARMNAEIAEYRRRFKEIEGNLYSGPNSGR